MKINKALFSYKMPLGARVENYLNVMQNPPIFSQILVLMRAAFQWYIAFFIVLVYPEKLKEMLFLLNFI